MSTLDYTALLAQAQAEIKSNNHLLDEARELAQKIGLSIDSDLTNRDAVPSVASAGAAAAAVAAVVPVAAAVPPLTGGHSNTDHIVVLTGDYTTDRIAELRRNLLSRRRLETPEARGDDKWDVPKRIAGTRRRRIKRERDEPRAPPEPPPSGYIVFLGQMTTKFRYERKNERHSQAKAVLEICKMWGMALSETDREYYNTFSEEARKEYKRQHLEFRATGHYTPSTRFERLDGAGLWVHKQRHEKNALELEIATYDTVVFPMRPPEFEEEYKRREQESKEKRKAKLQALNKGTRKRKKAPPSADATTGSTK